MHGQRTDHITDHDSITVATGSTKYTVAQNKPSPSIDSAGQYSMNNGANIVIVM